MLKTRIILSDGTVISSGAPGVAVIAMTLQEAVNSGEDLHLGSVCAAVAEVTLMTEGICPLGKGDRFWLFKGDTCLGQFTAEKPQWISAYQVRITAYDNVALLDRDISGDFAALTQWPYTLEFLANWVCALCGTELGSRVPMGGFPASPFQAEGLTGRQLMGYIAEAAGRFCRADRDGKLVLDWYRESPLLSIGDTACYGLETSWQDGALTISNLEASPNGEDLTLHPVACRYEGGALSLSGQDTLGVLSGKWQVADYQVLPPQKVVLRQESRDVGVSYPDREGTTYFVTGNPLLAGENQPIAKHLFETVQAVSYTPMTVTVPLDLRLQVGDILTARGQTFYVMSRQITGNLMKLSCQGSGARDISPAEHTVKAMAGRVLRLQTDLEGIRAEHADTKGNLASLELSLQGIKSQVSVMESMGQAVSRLQQDGEKLALELERTRQEGASRVVTSTGYTFSESGLRIQKSGMEMENLLDHTGMTVRRGGRVILQADHQGVTAPDVTVGNFLAVAHARFEPYETGTACFYV